MTKLPSILNDVIGPVMRGPSSSHTAASWRIARTALDILNDGLEKALIEFDRDGAWASNYREQGTCMGIDGGLLDLDISDERLKDTDLFARQKGISIDYKVSSFQTSHANTVRLTLHGVSNKKVQVVAVSTGGGSFTIQTVNGIEVSINGDLFEMILSPADDTEISGVLGKLLPADIEIESRQDKGLKLYVCHSSQPYTPELVTILRSHPEIFEVAVIDPVMPVIAGRQKHMPFTTLPSMIDYAEKINADLGELGLIYERCISGSDDGALLEKMGSIVEIIHQSIDTGLNGTDYPDRILPQQSHLIERAEKEGKVRPSIVNQIIAYVSAIMESKSGMEVIVAAPTAGSCGTVGGALRAVAESIRSTNDELISAYFAAGIIGAYFAQGPGFSAEEHGCQVECGAASGMAAAGIVQLLKGNAKQAIDAASMAIQNMIGLVCDPVADRVEVPCLGKNLSAAVNAHASALMAISGFDAVIPLEQVIQTVSEVSKTMPACVKCTGKGGLAMTEASRAIKENLKTP